MDIHASAENGGPSAKENLEDLSVEDCGYMLRRLEQSALVQLISAMRAQGGLTEYREQVLNHVRNILHFTDTQLTTEMRRAANDPCLKRISEVLNPHYDTYTQWGAAGMNTAANDFDLLPEQKRSKKGAKNIKKEEPPEDSVLEFADTLLQLAKQHNDSVEEDKDLARELTELPVQVYVPETLRKLLRSSESDPTQRIEMDSVRRPTRPRKVSLNTYTHKRRNSRTEEARNASPAPPVKRKPGRRPKSESVSSTTNSAVPAPPAVAAPSTPVVPTATKEAVAVPEPSPVKPEPATPVKVEVKSEPSTANSTPEALNGNAQQAETPGESSFNDSAASAQVQQLRIESVVDHVVRGESPRSSHDTSDEQVAYARNSVSLLSDDPPFPPEEYFSNSSVMVGGKMQRRKRSKPRDNGTCVCARVQPFVFEPQVPGKPKPPRGNPDRRTAKRPSPTIPTGYPHSVATPILSPGGLPPQPSAVFNGSDGPSPSADSNNTPAAKNPSTTATPTFVNTATAKAAHFLAPGTYIKRARTVSSGEISAAIAEGVKSTILRGHAQAVPKGFVRSTNGTTRLYVTQNTSAAGPAVSSQGAAAGYSTPTRQYYARASSVSSDGGSSTSSAQQTSGVHIASLVTPGGPIARVGTASSPSKDAKSPAYSENPQPSGSEGPSASFQGPSGTIVKNAVFKRSIITRHNSSPGARILTSGSSILKRAPVQQHDRVVYTTLQPLQQPSEQRIVVRNVAAPTVRMISSSQASEAKRIVAVVPTTASAVPGPSAAVVQKSDSPQELPAAQNASEAATSEALQEANLLLPVEYPECAPGPSARSDEPPTDALPAESSESCEPAQFPTTTPSQAMDVNASAVSSESLPPPSSTFEAASTVSNGNQNDPVKDLKDELEE